jgi:hypothetical protein
LFSSLQEVPQIAQKQNGHFKEEKWPLTHLAIKAFSKSLAPVFSIYFIYQYLVDMNQILVNNKRMLEGVFGNKTAEKVLLHIFHYGESYASAIAKDFKTALNPVIQQLNRFEEAGILISKEVGRSRVYAFNPKSPLRKPLLSLLEVAYESIPLSERQKIFEARRRPRRKGKPVQ